jgi:hypothetical protein
MIDLFKLISANRSHPAHGAHRWHALQEDPPAAVMGEMVAGILLGPTFFGWLAPAMSKALFPAPSLGYLNALSQVGLVLFMFLVGLSTLESSVNTDTPLS